MGWWSSHGCHGDDGGWSGCRGCAKESEMGQKMNELKESQRRQRRRDAEIDAASMPFCMYFLLEASLFRPRGKLGENCGVNS